MRTVKHIHAEQNGNGERRRYLKKALPADKDFSNRRRLMQVRRDLARFRRIVKQANSLVDNIENEHEGIKALAKWGKENRDALPDKAYPMLRFLCRAYDDTDAKFRKAQLTFQAYGELVNSASDGTLAADPSILEEAIRSGKETVYLGQILIQTGDEFQRRVGTLQGSITAVN